MYSWVFLPLYNKNSGKRQITRLKRVSMFGVVFVLSENRRFRGCASLCSFSVFALNITKPRIRGNPQKLLAFFVEYATIQSDSEMFTETWISKVGEHLHTVYCIQCHV